MARTLEARGLTKAFGGIRAASGLSLTLADGVVTGLIGPNGAGKTTFFNMVTGFLPPDEGQVLWEGRDITGLPAHQIAQAGICRTWQDLRLYSEMTVLENVLVARPRQAGEQLTTALFAPGRVRAAEAENVRHTMELLERVHLAGRTDVLARNLSYAEQKLLSIARALATDATCFLMDEPLSGLDEASSKLAQGILRKLADNGSIVCLVEHIMDSIVGTCDSVFFMNNGSVLVQGSPSEVMANPELSRLYFGGDSAQQHEPQPDMGGQSG